jgi:hypothetical protein
MQLVADASRAAVLTRFDVSSCIATTRVVIEVLAYFGIAARPWAANVKLFNDIAWKLTGDGVPLTAWPPEAHSVSVDTRNGGDGIGHVVAVAGPVLVDASIDQAARPDKGLAVGPLVLGLPAGFDRAVPGDVLFELDGGIRLMYGPSGSRLYTTSTNWRRGHPAIRACVGEAVRVVRAGVDSLV